MVRGTTVGTKTTETKIEIIGLTIKTPTEETRVSLILMDKIHKRALEMFTTYLGKT